MPESNSRLPRLSLLPASFLVLSLLLLLLLPTGKPLIASAAAPHPAQQHLSASAPDTGLRPVQIFDVQQGKVVKTMPNDADFQQLAQKLLAGAKGPAAQFSPENKCGHVYRLPLASPASITLTGRTVSASELFIFYCAGKDPLLLVFSEDNKPFLLKLEADLAPLLDKTGLPAQGSTT